MFEPFSPMDDVMQGVWDQVQIERVQKVAAGVEQMFADPQKRGLIVVENQFGRILEVGLDASVPFGTVHLVRKELDIDNLVSPSTRSGGET